MPSTPQCPNVEDVPIRVVLVDDVPEVRRLVKTALRFRGLFGVVGEASTGAEAIEMTVRLRPDIVVLDIGLPDLAGQEVLTRIRNQVPGTKVVVFTGTEPRDSSGIDERVDGYAMKDSQLDYLVELLETVGLQHTGQTTVHLDGSLTSARQARAFASAALADWGVSEIVDDVLLVVTELVNNAVTHACSECDLRLSINPLALRIEVIDQGPGAPDPLPPSATRNHGRGLHLVDALTAAWGFEPIADDGKMVWAELLRGG
jgi:CheY-like chemotaxis protein/anti-sigma regulatory factor (Ser/Thr protein kinase)